MTVIGYGPNAQGELGMGWRGATQVTPVVSSLAPADTVDVQASYHFTGFLTSKGDLWMAGGNEQGEIGNGTNASALEPFLIAQGVKQFSLGGAHAAALGKGGTGTVVTWGANGSGQIGNGTIGRAEGRGQNTPADLPLKDVVQVACGGGSTGFLFADGHVEMTGENRSGQLGDGTHEQRLKPVPVKGLPGPVRKIAIGAVASHGGFSLFLLENGDVYGVGLSRGGQLGHVETMVLKPVKLPVEARAADIAAALSHCLVLTDTGFVRAFGAPGPWRPIPVGQCVSVSAGMRSTALVGKDGRLYTCGATTGRESESFGAVPGLTEVTRASVGEFHGVALANSTLPVQNLRAQEVPNGVGLSWEAPAGTEKWTVSERLVTHPKSKWTTATRLPASARSFELGGLLPGREVEVQVINHAFGSHIVRVVPL